MMERVERSIVVEVPLRTAYNQWTQFEDFPNFMPGVRQVWQLDDKRLRWRVDLAGVNKQWEAEIVEQMPDRSIVWRSVDGAENRGTVLFEPLDEVRTRVTVQLEYDPHGMLEHIGSTLGIVSSYTDSALRRYKQFIESRGSESGAWRGEIHGQQVQPGGSDHLQDPLTSRSIGQNLSGTTNAGFDGGDQPPPPQGGAGAGGDLGSESPRQGGEEAGDSDSTVRMAQMSAGRTGHGSGLNSARSARMEQMRGGTGDEPLQEREVGGSSRSQVSGRRLPPNEGLVDSDIPSDRERS